MDGPRHLSHGILLHDYVEAGFPSPRGYIEDRRDLESLVDLKKYPPLFYLLEAAVFLVFGTRAFVAKGLVLCFTLLATLYMVTWLRRFVGSEAGFLGAIFPMIPCVVIYSHAILLNMPSIALQLAALYHGRRWIQRDGMGQLWLAIGFACASLLCYQGAFVMPFVALTWLLISERRRQFNTPRVRIVAIVLILAGGLALWLLRWHPQIRWLYENPYLLNDKLWTWYPRIADESMGVWLLCLSAIGAVLGLVSPHHRREVIMSSSWVLVFYALHTLLTGKDHRYFLQAVVPLLSLASVAICQIAAGLGRWMDRRQLPSPGPALIVMLLASPLLGVQIWMASESVLPRVDGFTALIDEIDPNRDGDAAILLDLGRVNDRLFIVESLGIRSGASRRNILTTQSWKKELLEGRGKEVDGASNADEVFSPETLREALARSDFSFVLTNRSPWSPLDLYGPLTDENVTSAEEFDRALAEALSGSEYQIRAIRAVGGPRPALVALHRLGPEPDRAVEEADIQPNVDEETR